jgi:hypothetical protein
MTKLACLIKTLPPSNLGAFRQLYQLGDTELSSTGYIVISVMQGNIVNSANAALSLSETTVLESSAEGNVLSWDELEGSCRGRKNPEVVLKKMGYRLVSLQEFRSGVVPPPKKPDPVPVLDPGWVVDPEPEDS